ncbi:MAG: flagellin [Robiginitomaculum sp.]|nr:MAG: flagellin [Robiginitomaculum sp.]
MPRIATNVSNQVTLFELLRNQSDLLQAQKQVSSGKKSTDLKGLAPQLDTLNAAHALSTRNDSYIEAIKEVNGRLAAQNLALSEVASSADDLRQAVIDALSLGSGITLVQQLESVFGRALNGLNQTFAGRPLFGGSRVDTPPVNIKTLNDLGAAVAVSDVFDNTKVKATARVDEGNPIETGFLADDVGTDILTVIKSIKDFNDGASGPFTANLTNAQKTFLQSTLASISSAADGLNIQVGKNGLLQNRVENAQSRAENQQILLKGVVGDIEDIDLAEAATRLTQAQTAVEASARTFSLLRDLSLLNFLR